MLTLLYFLLTMLCFIEEKDLKYRHIDRYQKVYKTFYLENSNIYKIRYVR